MKEVIQHIPRDLVNFIMITLFSLLIGLEQRRHHLDQDFEKLFGTDRTFTLIGLFGYMLYMIDPKFLYPFLVGGVSLCILLSISYFQKIKLQQRFGLTSIITALITYCLGPLICTQPQWLVLLIVVTVLIITEIKESLFKFAKSFDNDEFLTLAKFLILAGIVLPLLPDKPVNEFLHISPYRIWLAVVIISGISYCSYLLKKFVFPDSGILLTGILGGLYSSTATTIILAKKSINGDDNRKVVPAIILATSMMYIRIFFLSLFFNVDLAISLLPYFIIFILLSSIISILLLKLRKADLATKDNALVIKENTNPLEFKTAVLFAILFIVFSVVTGYVLKYYGGSGVNIMAFIVGVTDIDPFIINLFQGQLGISNAFITIAVINAMTSNNVLKLIYALFFSDKSLRKDLVLSFGSIILLGIIISVYLAF